MSDSKYEGLQIANPLTLEPEWLAKVQEDIFDPERVIIDTHHHLWSEAGLIPYSLEDFLADTDSGHNVVKSVFMECHSNYYTDGPEHLRSLGEVAYITELADKPKSLRWLPPLTFAKATVLKTWSIATVK